MGRYNVHVDDFIGCHQIPSQAGVRDMGAAAALRRLAVHQGSHRNSVCEDHPPEETSQRHLVMEGRLLTGRAEGEVQRRQPRQLAEANTHLHKDSDNFLPTPRPHSRPHFEHNTPDAPDVDLGIVPCFLAVDDLRCHPKDRPLHRSVDTDHADVDRSLRASEICNFAKSERSNENVGCL